MAQQVRGLPSLAESMVKLARQSAERARKVVQRTSKPTSASRGSDLKFKIPGLGTTKRTAGNPSSPSIDPEELRQAHQQLWDKYQQASRTVEEFTVYGPATSRLQPSAFCRPGQPKTRQRSRRKRRDCGKPSLMPIGTPSNAVAASTLSWKRSTKQTTKRRPRLERDWLTISSSGS